jgi:integrase
VVDAGVRSIEKGKQNIHKRKEVMLAHGFRKFFNTVLLDAGVKPVIKEMLLGHRVDLEKSYYRPAEGEFLQQYLSAAASLTISEEKALRR